MTDETGCKNIVVTELTKRRQLETMLFGFSRKLLTLNAILKRDSNRIFSVDATPNDRVPLRIKALLNLCVSEIVAISKLPESPLCEITSEVLSDYDNFFSKQVMSPTEKSNDPSEKSLTMRERQVVQYLAMGRSNKEIAAALGLSVKTVQTYRTRIMLKLDAHSLCELIHYAIKRRLVEI